MSQLILKDSASYPLHFLMVDVTDHVTGKTGLSPTVTISKNGAAFGSPAGAVTEIANGWYQVAGNATDSNTLGNILLHATGSGADPTDSLAGVVVAFNPQSATDLGLSSIADTLVDTNELQSDDVPGLIAALDAVVDTVKAETVLILADTADMQPKLGTPAGASISADIAAIKAETALIVADTNEMQVDWADGGRLDLILDSRMAESSIATTGGAIDNVTLVDTTTTNSDMRGTDSAALASNYSAARAGYLDNLNISENVAGSSEVGHLVSVSGTSDSGTTSTMVDAARTEVDNHWIGMAIVFGTGGHAQNVGVERLITGFTAASDTLTFTPVVLQAITTETYKIVPAHTVNLLAATQASIDATEADTADMQPKLGTPAGADMSADIAALKAETALIVADTNELQVDWADGGRLDLILDARASQVSVNTIDDFLDTEIADIITTLGVAGAGLTDLGGMSTAMKAEVNAEALDVLATDARGEPAQGAPGVSISVAEKVDYLYKSWRNRTTVTATLISIYADNGTTVDHKMTISDDSTTFDREEVVTGA